jgi:CubicO group peptidase (beta-lactamase class C family)
LRLLCAAIAALLPISATATCAPPPASDGWAVAAPESVGIDADRLCALVPWVEGWKEGDIHAVLVARHAKLVFEQYFSGADEHWGTPLGNDTAHSRDQLHDARSVTKSVVALVLGIALDRGLIKGGLDTPVLDLLPQYADLRTPEKVKITLRHLLTMSAGLKWDEDIPYGNPGTARPRWTKRPTRRGSRCHRTSSHLRAKFTTTAAATPC